MRFLDFMGAIDSVECDVGFFVESYAMSFCMFCHFCVLKKTIWLSVILDFLLGFCRVRFFFGTMIPAILGFVDFCRGCFLWIFVFFRRSLIPEPK